MRPLRQGGSDVAHQLASLMAVVTTYQEGGQGYLASSCGAVLISFFGGTDAFVFGERGIILIELLSGTIPI